MAAPRARVPKLEHLPAKVPKSGMAFPEATDKAVRKTLLRLPGPEQPRRAELAGP